MSFDEFKEKMRKTERRGAAIDKLIADRLKPGELVREHLPPCGDDLVLITLKGHLIIEHLLELNLARLLEVQCLPERLNFNLKFELLRTVLEQREPETFHDAPNADILCAIKDLNRIRNQFAHNLKSPLEIEAQVAGFIKEFKRVSGAKSLTGTNPEQLRKCIVALCRFLDAVRVHFFKSQVSAE